MSNGYFSTSVDCRSRKAMADFLSGHFKYHTMNSCNGVVNYAHKVKVHSMGLTSDQVDKAFDLIGADDSYEWQDTLQFLIDEYTKANGGSYTIGSNGRSGGYLVMYHSYYQQSQHKSRCLSCGQKNYALPVDMSKLPPVEAAVLKFMLERGQNWTAGVCLTQPEMSAIEATEEEKLRFIRKYNQGALRWTTLTNKCGRCGAEGERGRVPYSAKELIIQPGQGCDLGTDFMNLDEWSMAKLRDEVGVVMAFDKTCDAIREAFINCLNYTEVVEEEVVVTKKVKVLRSKEE
jgi:hypothetical protein